MITRNLNSWVAGDSKRELVRRTIEGLDTKISELSKRLDSLPSNGHSTGGLTAQQRADVAGLIGALAQPLIGSTSQDPVLTSVANSPGTGTVTSVTVAAGTNLTGGGTVTSSGTITLNTTLTPAFTSVSVNGAKWSAGNGSPEGAVTGSVGDLYSRRDGGAATSLYVKESGAGNTGWVAK
jgi:hypothetical protein